MKRDLEAPLTKRELVILAMLAKGMTATDIAEASYVSLNTVRTQIKSMLFKLKVKSQLQAVVVGVRNGLVEIQGPDHHIPADRRGIQEIHHDSDLRPSGRR